MKFWFALAVFAPSAPMVMIAFLAFWWTTYKQDRFRRVGKHVAAYEIEGTIYNAFKVMMIFLVLAVVSLVVLFTTDPLLPTL